MTRTLLLILAALTLMIGSFVWFVATWDREAEEPISQVRPALFILADKRPPEGRPAPFPPLGSEALT